MKQEKLVDKFLQEGNIFAVVGVSRNPEKYGYRVWKGLKVRATRPIL